MSQSEDKKDKKLVTREMAPKQSDPKSNKTNQSEKSQLTSRSMESSGSTGAASKTKSAANKAATSSSQAAATTSAQPETAERKAKSAVASTKSTATGSKSKSASAKPTSSERKAASASTASAKSATGSKATSAESATSASKAQPASTKSASAGSAASADGKGKPASAKTTATKSATKSTTTQPGQAKSKSAVASSGAAKDAAPQGAPKQADTSAPKRTPKKPDTSAPFPTPKKEVGSVASSVMSEMAASKRAAARAAARKPAGSVADSVMSDIKKYKTEKTPKDILREQVLSIKSDPKHPEYKKVTGKSPAEAKKSQLEEKAKEKIVANKQEAPKAGAVADQTKPAKEKKPAKVDRFAKQKESLKSFLSMGAAQPAGEETQVITKMGGERQSADAAHPLAKYFVPRTKPRNIYLGIAVTTFKMLLIVLLVFGIGAMGALFGVASAYVETSPIMGAAVLTDISRTSLIYDMHGNEIGKYTGAENRVWIKIDQMPQQLKDAFVSIEDTRFYSHEGIDYKRLFGSFVGNLQSTSVQGGSTISQQLVKMRMLSPERSYKRKIQEAYMTGKLENGFSKDQILEAYMNTVFLGGSNYGVQVAANDYFGKGVNDLTVRESAMLAGITQTPNGYNPRTNYYVNNTPEVVNKRTNQVLDAMYAAGRIDKAQYDAALAEEVQIKREPAEAGKLTYAYFIEYAITDITDHLLISRGLENNTKNRNEIDKELRESGYHIHLTIDTGIQSIVQDSLTNFKGYPKMRNPSDSSVNITVGNDTIKLEQPQASAAVYDYHTGEYRAIVGGRSVPFAEKLWNRAAVSEGGVGSSIKPIAVYAPALDLGMTPSSSVSNAEAKIPGWVGGSGYPKGSGPNGSVSIREAVVQSMNRATANTLMKHVKIEKSAEYLERMGVDPTHISRTPSGLALGTSPITTLEMAAAFGTLANVGVYQQPLSFTKVLDSEGKVILDGKKIQEGTKDQVFKPATALQITDILTDAVKRGTGRPAQIPGMTTAGKTGTNNDYKGICFSGYTPYYAATAYIGHDNDKPLLNAYGGSYAAPLWKDFMTKIHKDLPNKKIIEGEMEDYGLETYSICSATGKRASHACNHDILGNGATTKMMLAEEVPSEYCSDHITYTICAETHCIAREDCPDKIVLGMLSSQMSDYMSAAASRYPGFSLSTNCHSTHGVTTQAPTTQAAPPPATTGSTDTTTTVSGGFLTWPRFLKRYQN